MHAVCWYYWEYSQTKYTSVNINETHANIVCFVLIGNHLYCAAVHHGELLIEKSSFGNVFRCHASQESIWVRTPGKPKQFLKHSSEAHLHLRTNNCELLFPRMHFLGAWIISIAICLSKIKLNLKILIMVEVKTRDLRSNCS